MGGRLRYFLSEWEKITEVQWVLSLMKHGYKLEFLKIPPETGVRQTHASEKDTIILNQEVEKLLGKEVIEPVPLAELNQGSYSTFFLVSKDRGFTASYKLQTSESVSRISALQDGLYEKGHKFSQERRLGFQDSYFNISLHKNHRKYLRFCI